MPRSFKERVTVAGLGFELSVALWSACGLFFVSIILAVWASLSSPGGAAGQPGPGETGAVSTSTPQAGGPASQAEEVSAEEALTPFFSSDGPDIALLVGSPDSLTDVEAEWLEDIRMKLGPADAVAYADVSTRSLSQYLTVFVIDDSGELDVTALADAAAGGASVHLAGDAAMLAGQVIPEGGE